MKTLAFYLHLSVAYFIAAGALVWCMLMTPVYRLRRRFGIKEPWDRIIQR